MTASPIVTITEPSVDVFIAPVLHTILSEMNTSPMKIRYSETGHNTAKTLVRYKSLVKDYEARLMEFTASHFGIYIELIQKQSQ